MIEDKRKMALLNGLRQLTIDQLRRVESWKGTILTDRFNYHEGCWCPLAIGLGLPEFVKNPTQEKVYSIMALAGYKINNTWGVEGYFYTNNRDIDLRSALQEVILEKEAELYAAF